MFTMAPLAVSHKNSSMGSKDLQKQVNDKVVERYTSGEGYKKMSKALKIPPRTVKTIIKKVESVWHHPQSPNKSVRPSKLDDQERRHLVRETIRNSIATLKENMCITKSQRYCTHLARMGGWHEKSHFLFEVRRDTLRILQQSFVIGMKSKSSVWQKTNTSHHQNNTNPAMKHDGGSITVWEFLSSKGNFKKKKK